MHSGRSLLSLSSRDLCDVGYRMMIQRRLVTEEENEVILDIETQFENLAYEETTGMPAITRWMTGADGSRME